MQKQVFHRPVILQTGIVARANLDGQINRGASPGVAIASLHSVKAVQQSLTLHAYNLIMRPRALPGKLDFPV